MSGYIKICPGVYDDGHGTMHLDLAELLEANGYEDTPRNREMLFRTAAQAFAQLGIPVEQR
jgi:hypothetical protein